MLGYSFSVAIGVGFIALASVAIEINVLMLVYIKQSLKNNQLTKLHYINNAIIDGATLRVRAITMTVVAVISGLIPIVLSSGAGSEVMKRIATPMVGGMLSTLILSLILLPALYYQYLLIKWELKGDKK